MTAQISKNRPSCAIAIVNFNGQHFLAKLLDSILNLNYPREEYDIILVDNGSTDGSIEFVKNNYDNIKILNNTNNYARGLNLAVDACDSRYIAFLNTDMIVDKNWLVELINTFDINSNICCVGSKILFEDGETINSAGHIKLGPFNFADRGFQEKDFGQYDKIEKLESVCGGSVMWRVDVVKSLGGFDEFLIMYYEDVDMAHRAYLEGYTVFYNYKSKVHHKMHGTGSAKLAFLLSLRNRLLLLSKYCPEELISEIDKINCIPEVMTEILYENIVVILYYLSVSNCDAHMKFTTSKTIINKLNSKLKHGSISEIIRKYDELCRMNNAEYNLTTKTNIMPKLDGVAMTTGDKIEYYQSLVPKL